MTAERIRKLESIGFDWETAHTTDWSVRFQQLREFKEQSGHGLVCQSTILPTPTLGQWGSHSAHQL